MTNHRGTPRAFAPAEPVLTLLSGARTDACIRDRDTLKMERARVPDVLELITGKFRPHSVEYYGWRVQDRQTPLERNLERLALLARRDRRPRRQPNA